MPLSLSLSLLIPFFFHLQLDKHQNKGIDSSLSLSLSALGRTRAQARVQGESALVTFLRVSGRKIANVWTLSGRAVTPAMGAAQLGLQKSAKQWVSVRRERERERERAKPNDPVTLADFLLFF